MGTDQATQDVSAARLRRVLGTFATGVTVITAAGDDGPVGMAANSFTSVSLDPPLVLFCAGKSSTTWPDIEAAGRFCVNILGSEHADLSTQFATKDLDRFAGVSHRTEATGSPVLDDAIAWLDCEQVTIHDAGDHVIDVGQVLALDAVEDAAPLLFFRGCYGQLSS